MSMPGAPPKLSVFWTRYSSPATQRDRLREELTLAQIEVVSKALGRPVILLVDEPGADLDRNHLGKLLSAIIAAPLQAFITALEPDPFAMPSSARLFHVEQGSVRALL